MCIRYIMHVIGTLRALCTLHARNLPITCMYNFFSIIKQLSLKQIDLTSVTIITRLINYCSVKKVSDNNITRDNAQSKLNAGKYLIVLHSNI